MTPTTQLVLYEGEENAVTVRDIVQNDDLLPLLVRAYKELVLTNSSCYAFLEVTERFGGKRAIKIGRSEKMSQTVWIRQTALAIIKAFIL